MSGGGGARERRRARRESARRSTTPVPIEPGGVTAAATLALVPGDSAAPPEVPTPERAALAAVAAFQNGMPCACGHAFGDHVGSDGPCTYTDGRGQCSCAGFDEQPAGEATVVRLDEARLIAWARENAPEVVTTPGLQVTLTEFCMVGLIGESLHADASTLPAEHQPVEVLPTRSPSPAAPEVAVPDGELRWTATLMLEGTLTDDGRCFAPGSITWRDLPLTLMGMIETSEEGHVGAIVSGRIDAVWKDGLAVKAAGVFDPGEFGLEVARMVSDGTLRGVSVDTAIHSYEFGPRSDFFDDDGNWLTEPAAAEDDDENLLDILFAGDEDIVFVVTDGVIGAATVCPFPAFAGASITVAASLVAAGAPALWTFTHQAGFTVVACQCELEAVEVPLDGTEATIGEPLTASAAGLAPVKPPGEWFAPPEFSELTPLTVTDDGQIFGHAWAWDTCHTGIPDVCTTAPHSNADYVYFLLGEIECEAGERVACGKITLDTGHADRGLGQSAAAAHYDHTGTVAAHVVVGEDEHGGWVAGALHSEVSEDKARLLRGAVLSGDWRNVDGSLELVALLAVNVPGFPVPRVRANVVASAEGQQVMALVAAGIHAGASDEDKLAKVQALAHRASLHGYLEKRTAAGAKLDSKLVELEALAARAAAGA